MIRRILLALTMAGALIGLGALGPVPSVADEQATGLVQIIRVEYNVKGTDTAANAYLESVKVKNLSGAPVPMNGWTLEDLTGHVYHFPAAYVLAAGEEVNVRTGHTPSVNPASWWNGHANLYWNRSAHQYGNSADSTTLENSGVRVDRVAWNDFTIRP
jgi:hypothetical protein